MQEDGGGERGAGNGEREGESQHKYNSSYPHFPEDFESKCECGGISLNVQVSLNMFECVIEVQHSFK